MKKTFALRFLSCLLILVMLSITLMSCATPGVPPASESDPVESETAHTHKWGDWIILPAATCTSEGQAERACACGEMEQRTLPQLGHRSSTWIVAKEATLRESGLTYKICSECDSIFNETELPRLKAKPLDGISDHYQYPLRPNYHLSSCRDLKGSPVVVLIFIDDYESYWTESEVKDFTENQVLVGLDFLEESAEAWGVDLDFVVECYSTPTSGYEIKYEGIINKNLNNGGSTKDVSDRAAMDIGCESGWELYSYYKEKYPNDDIIFLNLVNKSGISYARNVIAPAYEQYAEHCVMFADYLTSSPAVRTDGSRASTVAMMILYLFGAESMFTSSAREQLAAQLYPDDVMFWLYDDITLNTIGDCTAYSIGWTNTVPEVCYNDQWWE